MDAPRFGLAAPVTELAVQRFIDLVLREEWRDRWVPSAARVH
jgi:hypothetical protein